MTAITELSVNECISSITLSPISRLDLIKYAGASGDFNPIHTIDEEAEKAGLPGIIAHGMWTMGNISKLFTPYMEQGFIQSFSTRFTGMVFLDDVLTLTAELTEKKEEKLIFTVKAVKQDETTAAKGTVIFNLY
ncbi:MaoC/PaaZ C-terminal domain-containing protein [Alteribacillus bidgolensis]|uniref:MaoC like domain-containing protein n=1 Tax=Alteribacillus bidgolensis TaxID=930129 RepID=A0A1G8CY78_9BACI|nr:MaoC/PaaZ C-terminal domain-containing protein [Alteribacillus bidgolensis]SDH50446.1 MaoC like domain-containing protein [Alteribacillus bidgolensis]